MFRIQCNSTPSFTVEKKKKRVKYTLMFPFLGYYLYRRARIKKDKKDAE